MLNWERVNDQVKIHILLCLPFRERLHHLHHPMFVPTMQKEILLDWYFPTDQVDCSEQQFCCAIRAKGPLLLDLLTNRGACITPAMVETAMIYCPNLVAINEIRGSRDLYQRMFTTWKNSIRDLQLDWYAHPDLVAQIIRECPKLQYIKLLPPSARNVDDLHHAITMALYQVMPRLKGLYMAKAFMCTSGNHQTSVMLLEGLTQHAHQMQYLDLTNLSLHFPQQWERRILDPSFRIVPETAPLQELCLRNAFVIFHHTTVIKAAPVSLDVPIQTLRYYEPLVDTSETLGWISQTLQGPVVDDDMGSIIDPKKDLWRTEWFEQQKWPDPLPPLPCSWDHHADSLVATQCLGLSAVSMFFYCTRLEHVCVDFAMLLVALELPTPFSCEIQDLMIDCSNVIHSSRNWNNLLQRLSSVTKTLPSVTTIGLATSQPFHNVAPALELLAILCPNVKQFSTTSCPILLSDIPWRWRDQLQTIQLHDNVLLQDLDQVSFPQLQCLALACAEHQDLDVESCYSFFKHCPRLQRIHAHQVPACFTHVAQEFKKQVFFYKSLQNFYLAYLH